MLSSKTTSEFLPTASDKVDNISRITFLLIKSSYNDNTEYVLFTVWSLFQKSL